MCLAIPAKVTERDGDEGWVKLGDAKVKVNLMLTEEAGVGSWVLVHAGFAIQTLTEEDARETFEIVNAMRAEEPGEAVT